MAGRWPVDGLGDGRWAGGAGGAVARGWAGGSGKRPGLGLRSPGVIENGFRVLYQRTAALVQKLQAARRDLALEAAIRKLHKYHLAMLDDFSYVTCEQAETSVLFALIGARYENRSLLVIANEPFSAWGKIFASDAMTVAAVDPPRPPLPHLRTQRRELPPPGGLRSHAGCRGEIERRKREGPAGAGSKRAAGGMSGPRRRIRRRKTWS